MSRRMATKNDGTVVIYGLDHIFGWFYQEMDDKGDCIVDEDSLSKGKLLDLLEDTDAPEDIKCSIAMDLPI
jgi:hypothetical protein